MLPSISTGIRNSLKQLSGSSGIFETYRLCVDEEEFELIKEIYRRFYNENEIIDIRDVIRALDEDPVLAGMNKNVQQKRV